MKIITLLVLVICSQITFAQSSTDTDAIFKMWMFLDHRNVQLKGMDPGVVKSDSLFQAYNAISIIKIDTLRVTNTLSPFYGNELNYTFLKVDLSNIFYTRDLKGDESLLFDPPFNIGYFLIAVNINTGISYRIVGFNTSDFLGFLSDFKGTYQRENYNKKLSNKDFFRNYRVDGVDFECLYNGLRQDYRNVDKYPCLRRNNDPIGVIH